MRRIRNCRVLIRYYTCQELIDNETTKKTNTDSAKWKTLFDSTIAEITSEGSKRLETIEKNDIELIRQYETLEDDILNIKVSETERNIVSIKPTTIHLNCADKRIR